MRKDRELTYGVNGPIDDKDPFYRRFGNMGGESSYIDFLGKLPSAAWCCRTIKDESGEILAAGECVSRADAPQEGELSFLVRQHHQRLGLGRLLVQALVIDAQAMGKTIIVIEHHYQNDPVARLAQFLVKRCNLTALSTEIAGSYCVKRFSLPSVARSPLEEALVTSS